MGNADLCRDNARRSHAFSAGRFDRKGTYSQRRPCGGQTDMAPAQCSPMMRRCPLPARKDRVLYWSLWVAIQEPSSARDRIPSLL